MNHTLHLRNVGALLIALAVAIGCTLSAEDTPAAAPAASAIVIVKATYGDLPDGNKTDVTDKVKGMLKPGENFSVDATNDNFGDPAEGVLKKLKIEYTVAGAAKAKEVNEGEMLTISTTGE